MSYVVLSLGSSNSFLWGCHHRSITCIASLGVKKAALGFRVRKLISHVRRIVDRNRCWLSVWSRFYFLGCARRKTNNIRKHYKYYSAHRIPMHVRMYLFFFSVPTTKRIDFVCIQAYRKCFDTMAAVWQGAMALMVHPATLYTGILIPLISLSPHMSIFNFVLCVLVTHPDLLLKR